MIVQRDVNPNMSIYYLGSSIIQALQDMNSQIVDFFDLYKSLSEKQKVSMQLFVLSIDWLYLAGAIKSTNNGQIEKCF